MYQKTMTGDRHKVHEANISVCHWNVKATLITIAFTIAIFLTVPVLVLLFNLTDVLAQEVNYPDPLAPANNADEVSISPTFQWKQWYIAEKYKLEIADNVDMDSPQEIIVNGTAYKYTGTLEYDTDYWWRVTAAEPEGGLTSPQFHFKTIVEPTSSTEDEPPAESSFTGSIKEFFEDPDWFLVGLIVAAIIVVVLAVYILMKPRKPQTGQNRWSGAQPQGMGGPQMSVCPTCGSRNPPGRKFCNSCGTNLIGGTQQSWGAPQSTACPTCGSQNPPGRKFCNNCGTNLLGGVQQQPSTPQPAVCPTCGSQNPAGRKFCNNCGGSLLGGAQQQPGAPQPAICPNCGSQNPEGRGFCSNCGASLFSGAQQQSMEIHQAFSCPICGATIATGVNPCSNCGTWLDWQ